MEKVIATYKSKLGEIELIVSSPTYYFDLHEDRIGSVKEKILFFDDGELIIKEFKLQNSISKNDRLVNSIGWSILIKATNDFQSKVTIYCGFKNSVKRI